MFGDVISVIGRALAPVNLELALAYAIAYPTKTHFDGLGTLLLDGGDAAGSIVVSGNGRGWLRMAHFFESDAEGACFFAVVEKCCKFGFGGTG